MRVLVRVRMYFDVHAFVLLFMRVCVYQCPHFVLYKCDVNVYFYVSVCV